MLICVALGPHADPVAVASTNSALDQITPPEPGAPALDMAAVDPDISPCFDFYEYACRPFIAASTIPPDQSSWSATDILIHSNQERLREILDGIMAYPTAETRQLADYYATCLDEASIDAAGNIPLRESMRPIERLRAKADIPRAVSNIPEFGEAFSCPRGSPMVRENICRPH
jgi:putative endopeptidase